MPYFAIIGQPQNIATYGKVMADDAVLAELVEPDWKSYQHHDSNPTREFNSILASTISLAIVLK